MEKNRERAGNFGLKIISVLLFLWTVLSLLGEFGVEGISAAAYSVFVIIMGDFAWAGPFVSLVTAILLWFYRPAVSFQPGRSRNMNINADKHANNQGFRNKSALRGRGNQASEAAGLPLPSGKLVSLEGFNKYFAQEELDISDPPDAEDIADLGQDFPSYFGEGEKGLVKPPARLTTLHGLKKYFEEVDQEVKVGEQIRTNDSASRPATEPANQPNLKSHSYSGLESYSYSGLEPAEFESMGSFEPGEELRSAKMEVSAAAQAQAEAEVHARAEARTQVQARAEAQAEARVRAEAQAQAQAQAEAGARAHAQVLGQPRAPIFWRLPELAVLNSAPYVAAYCDTESPKQLEKVLLDFGVKAKIVRVTRGPVITRYELAPAPGVKISKIVNLADDIALALAARDVRIEAPIPGQSAIGIEVPNKQARAVFFREVLETSAYRENSSKLKIGLGKDIADQPIIADMSKMPHLLVAGATGSGKSVCVTAIINSILFNATPDEVKFLMIDPKMVELNHYNGIPHLLAPVVTDPKKAATALKWIVKEMENRYELFAAAGVRDIERYNRIKAQAGAMKPALPWIIVVIDELADLMLVAPSDVEEAICRLAQMARAAGIHLVIATQRPSVDVITGVIKANIPSRISFAVTSQIDSRTILDATGAEKLLGRGDMLYSPIGINKPVRVQGCLVADEEVNRIIEHWTKQGRPEYLNPEHLFAESAGRAEDGNSPDDDLFVEAGRLFISSGMASVSFLQRRLKLGYARAARLMDMLEEQGVVGPYEGSKPRQILISLEEFEELFG